MIHEHEVGRGYRPGSDEARIFLNAGINRLLVKIDNYTSNWGLAWRCPRRISNPESNTIEWTAQRRRRFLLFFDRAYMLGDSSAPVAPCASLDRVWISGAWRCRLNHPPEEFLFPFPCVDLNDIFPPTARARYPGL